MKSATMRMICRFLIVALTMLPFQAVQAGMIGTDQVVSAATAQADRATVLNLLSRSEVAGQLQSLGLDLQTAQNRVAAMTDQEVHALAGQVDSLPAGAKIKSGGWAVIIIIIGVLIYYNWK
jgi:hypothetical protein